MKLPVLSRVRFHSTSSEELDGHKGTILGISADFITTFYIVLLDNVLVSHPDYRAITMISTCLEPIDDLDVTDVILIGPVREPTKYTQSDLDQAYQEGQSLIVPAMNITQMPLKIQYFKHNMKMVGTTKKCYK